METFMPSYVKRISIYYFKGYLYFKYTNLFRIGTGFFIFIMEGFKMKKILLFVLVCMLISTFSVFAGDGGGVSVPELAESFPADDTKGVAIDSEIKLVFTNNIADASVRENNIEAISMVDENGNNVEIEVVLADTQIEPDKKRDIVIMPINELEEGTTYTIKVSENLTSKNGVSAEKAMTVSFTTAGEVKDGIMSNKVIIPLAILLVIIVSIIIFKKKK